MGPQLKIWADRFPFRGNVKFASVQARPAVIVICSNYHPSQIWTSPAVLQPIMRRFQMCHLKKPFGYKKGISEYPEGEFVYEGAQYLAGYKEGDAFPKKLVGQIDIERIPNSPILIPDSPPRIVLKDYSKELQQKKARADLDFLEFRYGPNYPNIHNKDFQDHCANLRAEKQREIDQAIVEDEWSGPHSISEDENDMLDRIVYRRDAFVREFEKIARKSDDNAWNDEILDELRREAELMSRRYDLK